MGRWSINTWVGAVGLGCLALASARAQEPDRIRISGYVRSAASGEVVRYALVSAAGTAARTQSNQDGFYTLELPRGRAVILVRAVGFEPLDTALVLDASMARDFELVPRPVQLEEVTVRTRADSSDIDPAGTEMSVARLDVRTVKLLPVVMGELDPIRSLTLLPGVSAISDFSTGFSVRGGSADQNLILLDESTIYNPSHVFGFLSVFNGDAIDDVKLYKGAIPARFGGRLSSVLDVRQREGNAREFEGAATIGLLSSRLSLEGPLPGLPGSWLVAGRRTYADLFLKLSSDPDLNRNTAYFYDLNAKGNVRLGQAGTLMLSGYFGRDRFGVRDRFSASWGNAAGTLRWNHAFGHRLFSKATLTVSDYDYGLEFLGGGRGLAWTARIASIDARVDQTFHVANGNVVEVGAEVTRHHIRPGSIRPVAGSPIHPVDLEPRFTLAPAVHASHEIDLGSSVSIRYGLRLAGLRRTGPATVLRYANDAPIVYSTALGRHERGTVVDTVRYADGEPIRAFTSLEPRASIRVGLTSASSLKASFARTRQFLHLVSNTNAPTPVDIWEPAGPYLEPQRSDQVAFGYVRTWGSGAYELSVETYYRWLDHVTDFIDGADIALNDRLETEMLQGRGRAYGVELYARKGSGRLTGWLSYTLGRSERRLPGVAPGDPGANGGRYYPSPYDKTHNLTLVALHPVSRRWTLGGTFVLSSGLPVTYPTARYLYDGVLAVEYADRNSARLPAYHRLDLTLTRTGARSQLQFGLFNLYNRFNAQSIAFEPSDDDPLRLEAVQTAIFGIVPSVSWTFRF